MRHLTRLAGVGIFVSEAAARELVGALNQLDQLAAPRAMRLSDQLEAIRRELQTCITRVTARVDTSVRPTVPQVVAQYETNLVDTTGAARELEITRDGVTWLCRHKHLRGVRRNGRWWIELASVQEYRERRGLTREM